MTKHDFAWLISSLMTTTSLRLEKAEIAFWYSCLSDLPDKALGLAFRRFAMSGDAWPSIAKLRALAAEYTDGRQMDWGEAWELLRRAGRIWRQHDRERAEEAHALLTPRLEKLLRQLGGFIVLTEADGDKLSVLQSNFRSAWTMRNERESQERCLPEELRPRIAADDSQQLPAVRLLAESTAVDDASGEVA